MAMYSGGIVEESAMSEVRTRWIRNKRGQPQIILTFLCGGSRLPSPRGPPAYIIPNNGISGG